jgi:hypothetical protein
MNDITNWAQAFTLVGMIFCLCMVLCVMIWAMYK